MQWKIVWRKQHFYPAEQSQYVAFAPFVLMKGMNFSSLADLKPALTSLTLRLYACLFLAKF